MSNQDIEGLRDRTNGSTDSGRGLPQDSVEYYRELIEFSANAIISIDERGIVELYNKAAEDLFGYTRDEVVGQNIKMLMPAPYRDQHDGYIAKYLRTGEKNILGRWREVEGQRKDGTRFPAELGVREFWVDGQRLFTGIVSDLTELKRAQTEIARKAQDVLDLSTPVLSVWQGVLVLPLIGTLDSRRMQDCVEKALTEFSESGARVVILDITGVPVIDTMVANNLIGFASSVRLMGGYIVITGISPATAMTIVGLGLDLSMLNTRGTLQEGLKLAIEMTEKPRRTWR